MSPWTALLESLHSSVIDELNARLPDRKPVLGMPMRFSEWKTPAGEVVSYGLFTIELAGQKGLAAVGIGAALEKSLQLTRDQFWQALLKRAGAEFSRRGIQPKFSSAGDAPGGVLPKSIPPPGRMIWMPLAVDGSACVFGIGV